MEKKEFESPELTVIEFDDIIDTVVTSTGEEITDPPWPSSQ